MFEMGFKSFFSSLFSFDDDRPARPSYTKMIVKFQVKDVPSNVWFVKTFTFTYKENRYKQLDTSEIQAYLDHEDFEVRFSNIEVSALQDLYSYGDPGSYYDSNGFFAFIATDQMI